MASILQQQENEIFPGRYQSKKDPRSVVRVTQVKNGLVCVRGVEGPVSQALMGGMSFMTDYKKI